MVHPAFAARQRSRWLRPDASRWLRPDAAKFLKPGTDPADVYPALAQQRDIARRNIDAALAQERAALDGLRRDLDAIKADLAWRRLVDAVARKYSPSQPRVPAGQTGGGQWTSGSGGSGRPRVIIDTTNFDGEGDVGDNFGAFGDDDLFTDGFDDDFGFDEADDSSGLGEMDDNFRENDSRPDTSDWINERDRSDEQPRRINDSRIVSDADPEPIRPGQQYATGIRSLTDASGNPIYRAGGHHEYPRSEFNKLNLPPETRRIFDEATTGTLFKSTVRTSPDGVPIGHLWDKHHREYSSAINELATDFIERNKITTSRMTSDQAIELLAEIRRSEDPRIRDYNRAIRMLNRVFRLRSGRSE